MAPGADVAQAEQTPGLAHEARDVTSTGDAVSHASEAGELPGGDGDRLAGPCAVAAPRRVSPGASWANGPGRWPAR